MRPIYITICEKQSYLTASLEREYLEATDLSFRWFPYLDDFLHHLENNACDLAMIDCPHLSQEQLDRIAVVSKKTCLMAIAPEEDFEFECLLRELGVVSVLPHGIDIQDLLRTVQRLIENFTFSA